MHHVLTAGEIELRAPDPPQPDRFRGLRRQTLVGQEVGAVHTGFALVTLEPGGLVATHVHSTEQSFYILRGSPVLVLGGVAHRLEPGVCGLIPVGVSHSWYRDEGDEEPLWLEANAPAPRISGPPDTFFTGEPSASGLAETVDIRDPRSRHFFRLGGGEMDLDNLKVGAPADAPTVSASMATALLAYSGIAVKMLVDQRLGAVLHTMFMVEYQPNGVAQPHDHPLEEIYYVLEGEVEATADDQTYVLRPGDVLWTGVGCIHAFSNKSKERVRWIETQSPQPPANHSYRFNRDWEYLSDRLGGRG
jgi:quercetin dioxygenase-like cupin family protein